jgi:hypothetical protein
VVQKERDDERRGKSNAAFESMSIASVACMFLFLYGLAADPMYIGDPPRRQPSKWLASI